MGCDIDEIDTIGESAREALAARGVTNTNHLLKHCATAQGRAELARMTRLREADLHEWVLLAELLRLPNLNKRSLNLLCAAGVKSLDHLRDQQLEPLMERLQHAKSRTGNPQKVRLPSVAMVEGWLSNAPGTHSDVT